MLSLLTPSGILKLTMALLSSSDIGETMLGAFGKFLEDVKARDFPSEDESY